MEEPDALQELIAHFAAIPGKKVLVHGGGRTATDVAGRLGLESRMVQGRRITDADTLDVITMVYGGLISRKVVAQLQAAGVNAVGLTGADLNLIRARKRPVGEIDWGFVGDVESVNGDGLHALLETGAVPVFAAITHDGHGQLFNTNADTIAAELAAALSAYYDVTLAYCFEHPGVMRDLNDPNSLVAELTSARYRTLKDDGTIKEGMLPKLDNGFRALAKGAQHVVVCKSDQLQFQQPQGTWLTEA
ncbi:acetylglutamate kinase [Catalinimonas alkaloidigena]|uniref:Acetylglutamate kinase n=1 Tax=Catalinimonas alkaloidigena TaxID=1075417 RepID=A0A1G9T596_9BACT|nr:acetylglutamate kinase [Catalinimonas alkaloidigena]